MWEGSGALLLAQRSSNNRVNKLLESVPKHLVSKVMFKNAPFVWVAFVAVWVRCIGQI